MVSEKEAKSASKIEVLEKVVWTLSYSNTKLASITNKYLAKLDTCWISTENPLLETLAIVQISTLPGGEITGSRIRVRENYSTSCSFTGLRALTGRWGHYKINVESSKIAKEKYL